MGIRQTHRENLPRPLENGLTLRLSQKEDIERLAKFFVQVFVDDDSGKPDERIGFWVRDVLTLQLNPSYQPSCLMIEEDATHRIASALIIIPQIWTYSGIPILAGRPEPVGTDKNFRKQGLVRALFQEFHHFSAERGDLLQGITGIPYYYRQFGYEMAVELGGSRSAFETQVKAAAKLDKSGKCIRTAVREDIPFLHDCYQSSAARYLLHCPLKPEWWENELNQKNPNSIGKQSIFILETAEKKPAGLFILSQEIDDKAVVIRYLEIKTGFNWQEYLPMALVHAWDFGQTLAAKLGRECSRLCLGLGSQHPAYVAGAEFLPELRRPYNWFLRVPDLPKLIRHIAPILESRLANSPFCGYSGKLKISFYRSDMHLEFQSGALASAEAAPASLWHEADVCFPDLTFLQLLFGYRSSRDLCESFADCRISEKFIPLLDVLFPKQNSLILPVE